MANQFNWNQFKSGWIPSDDSINGRKDGCLQMDNLELDKNGSLSLQGGTAVVGSAYAHNAHTIFSNVISGSRHDYVADTNGGIFRDGSSIGTGGDATNAAFSTAFDFTLVASGATRLKDSGSGTPSNLGITTPGGAPTATVDGTIQSTTDIQAINIGSSGEPIQVYGLWSQISANFYGFIADVAYGAQLAVLQTHTMVATTPIDFTSLTAHNATSTAISNLSFSDQDILNVVLLFYSSGDVGTLINVDLVQLDILLVDPAGSGNIVSDYFTFQWQNNGQDGLLLNIPIQRSQFIRIGSGNQGWESVYGWRLTIVPNAYVGARVSVGDVFYGATLNGEYDWAQVNVYKSSSYVGKSQIGPQASGFARAPNGLALYFDKIYGGVKSNPSNNTVEILPYITAIDPQVTEIWIFRRGGNLQQWYRTLVFTAANWTVPQYDYLVDTAVETIGITVNLNLISINSTGITDKIYDIVGPIEGRWFYFTTHFMYPSDINDPDLVDVSLGVRTTGSNAEIFLWARKIAYNQILVGTSRDIYMLTGTFVTLPDGTVDIYYDSIGCKTPPITYDAAFASGQVFYLAADGWRSTDASNNNQLLVAPNTDRLYRGITAYGYSVNIQIVPGSVRFPTVFARNKLWCSITGQSRIEVLDSIRTYWRNFSINKGDCLAICGTQDGQILAFFGSDKKLRLLDQQSSLEIDGATKQAISILSPVFDGGTPKQRHEFYTLKIRLQTGAAESMAVSLIDDTGTSHALGNVVSSGNVTEQILDLSGIDTILSRFWQYSLTGTFSNLTLDDVEIDFDTRPIQLTSLRLLPNNYGSASKKRVRVWPHVLDTLGNNITFTPDVDGIQTAVSVFQSNRKQTFLHFFNTDVFGIDYGGYLTGGLFEYFGELQPDIVQTLPIARQFDQVGPEELWRYGKIKKFQIRVQPFGGTSLPWQIYLNDNSVVDGFITMIDGMEATYEIQQIEGVGGSIARVVFGPTTFNFHRFYIRMLVAKSGRDSDSSWVIIPDPTEGEQG